MDYKELASKLILKYQKSFPLVSRPFELIASELNIDEETVRLAFLKMQEEGIISRVGPIFGTHKVGYSFLAAVECPTDQIESVSSTINKFEEVNHNYLRENALNIWFVLTGKDKAHLDQVVQSIEVKTGLKVHRFPMVRPFKIDLSLKGELKW